MVKKTVRDQVYTLKTYLKYVDEGDICDNADVQRLAGSFDKREINEIIYTTLTGDHIPEIILAECNEDNHIYIADGLQRTTMLKIFRKGKYKITSAIDTPIVKYMRKRRDSKGEITFNERGQAELEEAEFDIRNKTYDMLPEELKKEFNDFQIRFVIHEDCTMKRISDLIKRYNYQRPMTSSQKAFTYMDNFAVKARDISNKSFFAECSGYSEKEKVNGTIERVVAESVMCMFHLDKWKKSSKSVCEFLNKHSDKEEFEKLEEVIEHLGRIAAPDFDDIFTSKNSFVWFRTFHKFGEFGLDDEAFLDFIREFNGSLKDKVMDGITYKDMSDITYSKLDKEPGTKDKALVMAKIQALEKLMEEYFDVQNTADRTGESVESFLAQNVGISLKTVCENMELYNESLDMLLEDTVRLGSKLRDKENRSSLLAMMAYSYKTDKDLDDWMAGYAKKNHTYLADQRRNFLLMREDFEQ